MKYLVMENHFSYSIVLDEKGQFIKVANMGFDVGETIEQIYPINNKTKINKSKKIITLLTGVAACFIILFSVLYKQPLPVYASIYLNINPQFKIDVDKNGTILELKSLNNDAKSLTKDYKWKKKNIETLSKEIVRFSIDSGYLKNNGELEFSIDSTDENWFNKTKISLENILEEFINESFSFNYSINRYVENKKAETETSPTLPTESTIVPTEVKEITPTPPKTVITPKRNPVPVYNDSDDDDDDDDDNYDDDDDDDDDDNYDDDDDD